MSAAIYSLWTHSPSWGYVYCAPFLPAYCVQSASGPSYRSRDVPRCRELWKLTHLHTFSPFNHRSSFIMLYQQLVAALLGALATAPSTLASPLGNSQVTGTKREIPSTHVLHERQLPHWSSTWVRKHPVEKSAVLPMRIGLRQVKQKEGHNLLMDRSNPRSANFGKHMSAREVIDFFAPSRESVEAVRDWLVAGGINATKISQSVNKQVRFYSE